MDSRSTFLRHGDEPMEDGIKKVISRLEVAVVLCKAGDR